VFHTVHNLVSLLYVYETFMTHFNCFMLQATKAWNTIFWITNISHRSQCEFRCKVTYSQ